MRNNRKSAFQKRRKTVHSNEPFRFNNPKSCVGEKAPVWPPDCSFEMLIPELQHALSDKNFEAATPVQNQCIPFLLKGKDLLASAQTGTGKTAAFILPLLQQLNENRKPISNNSARYLILAPTRELALQIHEGLHSLGSYLKFREAVVYGGVSQRAQVNAMRKGVDFLIATPGRLLDLMQQGHINLDAVETLVLDEADRMLDMGFINDIRHIITKLPEGKQTAFFSATFPREIQNLSKELLVNPERVIIAPEKVTVDKISQKLFFVSNKSKNSLLLKIVEDPKATKVIIFAQMKHTANKLAEKLNKSGVNCMAIHGNKSQAARIKALDKFRHGQLRVLIATDVAARGIDVEGVTHVINYQLPQEPETYVHRIGRTGRAGESGQALSFCSENDLGNLTSIERMLKQSIPKDYEHPFHCSVTAQMTTQSPNGVKRKNKARPHGKQAGSASKSRRRTYSWRSRKSNARP